MKHFGFQKGDIIYFYIVIIVPLQWFRKNDFHTTWYNRSREITPIYLRYPTSVVRDVHRTPIGIFISDWNADGGSDVLPEGLPMCHITGVANIKCGVIFFYPKEATCIHHVNRKFWVYHSVSVRSMKLKSYSVSVKITNFLLLTPAVYAGIQYTLLHCVRQCHCIWTLQWT